MPSKSNKEDFINKSIEKHGDLFNYESVDYINNKIKVEIICPKHGGFLQRPNDHLTGYGCKKCQYEKTSKENRYTKEIFVNKSIEIHGNKFDYDFADYVKSEIKVNIICPKHGIFKQTPHAHMGGNGCPFCHESKGEKEVARILAKYNIPFIRQKTFNDLKDISYLYYDFYLPNHKLMIEYHGIQHWKPLKFFGGDDGLRGIRLRDMIKYKYAVNNGYEIALIFNVSPKYLEDILVYKLRKKLRI
jgi:very-short-patch-repair endonuclease